MVRRSKSVLAALACFGAAAAFASVTARGQLVDRSLAPNTANEGIAKSFADEIGAGRGDVMTPGSSMFVIERDPFRAIRRGRQLFQRKFTKLGGLGPNRDDGVGDIDATNEIGAGLSDSCAGCHGRPRGSAGFGGDVATRPDSRDAPHLFGLGLKEMLADEITTDLRATRARAVDQAHSSGANVTLALESKGISYGSILAHPDGSVDTSQVAGVDPDLRVRPFFAHGDAASIREFVVGALHNELGLESVDPMLAAASTGGRMTTPAGMVLDGSTDRVDGSPAESATVDPDGDGVRDEVPEAIVDYLEFYLLNYFKPATYRQTRESQEGQRIMAKVGCTSCHVPDLTIQKDRRVADLDTVYDETRGNPFNRLFATATPKFVETDDKSGFATIKRPALQPFVVKNIYTDFKRHDLGPNFHERNYDGTSRSLFLTTPLWGVGTTAPYGHDGRSVTLEEVIMRHGGEAQPTRDRFAKLSPRDREAVMAFLRTLVLFPPDDTASTLDPGDPTAQGYPQAAHGSIKLTVLFDDPTDRE